MPWLTLILCVVISSCNIFSPFHRSDNHQSLNKRLIKIGSIPLEEDRIDYVIGIKDKSFSDSYLSELLFKISGNSRCNERSITCNIDYGPNPELLLLDTLNQMKISSKIATKKIEGNIVKVEYFNPNPGIDLNFIEYINLRPDGIPKKLHIIAETQCEEEAKIELNISKFKEDNISNLIQNYVKQVLSKVTKEKLLSTKVIFSFNSHLKYSKYLVDGGELDKMQVLTYAKGQFIIKNTKGKVLNRIAYKPNSY